MVELDVQMTADHVPIVFHDNILGRTTNGHGHIRKLTAEQARGLDAGSWFDPRFADERIPLLVEALALIRDKVYLNIELKPLDDSPHAKDDVRTFVDLVRSAGLGPTMAFSSFDHRTLALVKHYDPSLHTIAINVPGDNRQPHDVLAACGADAYGCSLQEMTHRRADDCRAHTIPFGVYTVNTESDLLRAMSYGVNAVVSNYPDRIMTAWEHHRA